MENHLAWLEHIEVDENSFLSENEDFVDLKDWHISLLFLIGKYQEVFKCSFGLSDDVLDFVFLD